MIFCLRGKVHYDVGSCHDSREVKVEKRFGAPNITNGIVKAKKIIAEYHEKHSHLTDYTMSAILWHEWRTTWELTRKVWETRWVDAQDYVPPRPAIPARKAGFRSKRFK
jgi:hypothetical protein